MAITARITNVIKDGNGIRVFAEFTDGDVRSYLFDDTVTRNKAISIIKTDVDFKNSLEQKVQNAVTVLVNEVIS
jgi:hypothetical protein